MHLDLVGRKALITGASTGIGLACAKVLAEEGCSVTLVARDADRLAAVAADLRATASGPVASVAADLSIGDERVRLAAAHADADILINNAGAIPGGGLLDLSMDTWSAAWQLKVLGYVHLTQLYLDAMKGRGRGVILNVIGTAGRSPTYDYICGAAGNAALIAFTSAVGAKAAEWGVRVLGVNPGPTRTDRIITLMKTRAKATLGDEGRWEELVSSSRDRMAEPSQIADAIAFLCSPRASHICGTVVDIDDGAIFRR